MFCPSDLPVAKFKAQQLQEAMAKALGDETFEDYIVHVRAGHNVAEEQDAEGNFIRPRPDVAHEPCYQVTVHRKSDNMHAEEMWRPDFGDKCRKRPHELDKAVRRFVDAFDIEAAKKATIQ